MVVNPRDCNLEWNLSSPCDCNILTAGTFNDLTSAVPAGTAPLNVRSKLTGAYPDMCVGISGTSMPGRISPSSSIEVKSKGLRMLPELRGAPIIST